MASSAARKPGSNGYYANPNQIFDKTSRQFLSSRAGEKTSFDLDDDPRQRRGGGYVSPPPNPTYLPPLVKPNGYPTSPNGNGYGNMTKQQQLAAQIGRASTAAPRPQPPPDRHGTPTSLYPHHLLRSPTRSKTNDAYIAPYSSTTPTGRERSSSTATSYTSSNPSYGSPLASPPSSTASPPPPHPNSPTYSSPQSLPRHHHQPHRSLSNTNSSSYTDYTPNSKLLPQRSSKHRSTGSNGIHYPGPGAVGPALSAGIYPVLPKPPSVVGSAQPTPISRKTYRGARPIIDEDEEASNALNTYG